MSDKADILFTANDVRWFLVTFRART